MKYFQYILSAFAVALIAGASCKDDDFNINGDRTPSTEGMLMVRAKVSHPQSTRSYIPYGPVTSGSFVISYPYTYAWVTGEQYGKQFHFNYHFGTVTFGFAGEETTGFVNIGTGTAPRELTWSSSNSSSNEGIIYYPSASKPSPLYLDNMPYIPRNASTNAVQVDTIYDVTTIPDMPFKPGVFDDVNGTNDLLWGTTSILRGTDFVEFDLYHRMTLLNITVNVDNTDPSGYKTDLSNAKIWIDGLLLEPKSYLRKYGELRFESRISATEIASSIPEELYDTSFTLVEPPTADDGDVPDGDGEGENEEPAWNSLTWSVKPSEITNSMQTYRTKDFVFVPQTLRQGATTRPRLVIQVPRDDVNSAINPGYYDDDYIYYVANLPYTMTIMNDDGTEGGLMTFDFLRGYEISLTTKLKPGEPELLFAPVTVEPWVWKGSFKPESRQAGIFNPADFYNLVETYQENNSFWLGRYGFISAANQASGKWTFQFNSGELKLEIDRIMGTMYPGTAKAGPNGEEFTPPFVFDFRNRNQNYVMPNGKVVPMGTSTTAQNTLFDIVTAERNVGVGYLPQSPEPPEEPETTAYPFADLISAYQYTSWNLFAFGEYKYNNDEIRPGPGYWQFKIVDDITLDYPDIVAQMIPDVPNYLSNFEFIIEPGVTVTVNNYPDLPGGTLTVTSANPNQLYEIVSERENGIYTLEEFLNVMDYYNSGLDLDNFSTNESGSLVFPIWRDLTLTSSVIQGSMQQKPGEPYSFDLQGHNLSLKQLDGSTFSNASAADLYLLLNLNEVTGINGNEQFMGMIQAYKDYDGAAKEISSYGYYCFNSPRWVFYLKGPLSLKRDEIFGIISDQTGKLPFSFDFNKNAVYIIGDTEDDYELLQGDAGEAELVKILLGQEDQP